ncbi:MAG: hypothetical protein V6Z89_04125, partial [Desulfobacter sp.]
IFIGVKTIPERHYHRHPSLGIFCWSPEKDGYARGNVKLSGKILTFSAVQPPKLKLNRDRILRIAITSKFQLKINLETVC